MATKQKEVEKWITVNGVHVPVFKGQSVEEAVKKVTGKKDGGSNKQPSKTKDQSVKKDGLKENKQISKDQDLKEKQIAENKKQADAANLNFITDADKKILATPKGLRTEEKQVRVDGLRRVLKSKIDSMYSTYSQQYSADPNNWLQYGDKGKEAYHRYKEAVERLEPDKTKRAKYFKDRRKF